LGSSLVGGRGGKRVRVSKTDNLERELMFPTSVGDVRKLIRGSSSATKLSNYFQDRDRLLRGKLSPDDFETKWRGVHIDGQELLADTSVIFVMAEADVLKLEHLYAGVGSEK